MSRVLITGASRGIGRALAIEFTARGHEVTATARDVGTLQDLEVSRKIKLDVTSDDSVAAAVASAGDIDVLVSNAGAVFFATVEATPPDELLRLFDQNAVGAVRLARSFLPGMRQRGSGRLLFMSSVLGRVVSPLNAGYAATKWALEALVESLATEVAPFGIDVGLIEPSTVDSGASERATSYSLPDDPYADARKPAPTGDPLTPKAVAVAVADAADLADLPLRIPVGPVAGRLLARRHTAPDNRPFDLTGD